MGQKVALCAPRTKNGVMQPKAEELLNFLLWSASKLMRPTFRNLMDSYEGWAYRNGLARQVSIMEKKGLIERERNSPESRICRLTAQGRLHALGGRDPEAQWARPWDGRWRMVLFDIPLKQSSHRKRMRRYLRSRGFGCLQRSVWLTPDPLDEERSVLARGEVDAGSLVLIEFRPCAGESDGDLVSAGWDFRKINGRYASHLRVLDERPRNPLSDDREAKKLRRWASIERCAWLEAIGIDPLLPRQLVPSGYLGERAWRRRIEVLREAGRQLAAFRS